MEITMKSNKYRWREMKDERPLVGEEVIVISWNIPFTAKFINRCSGCEQCHDNEIESYKFKSLIDNRVICDAVENFIWRKMCKLPGEK